MSSKTDILIVTYGNRWQYLTKVLSNLLNNVFVNKIIIVNNNSTYNIQSCIDALESKKILLLQLDKNYGSAYGYKYGMSYFLSLPESEMLCLLDDDNLFDHDCLSNLLTYWEALTTSNKENSRMLMAMRKNRSYLTNASKASKVKLYFPLTNHFFGFNMFRLDRWLYKKLCDKFILPNRKIKPEINIPCAPYGGLLFHKKALISNGLPDERFFTYSDDFEFTKRFTHNGGSITLLPNACITDIDNPLINNARKGFLKPKFLDMDLFRLYFLIRNTIFFTKKYYVSNKIIFTINRYIYTCYLYGISLLYSKEKSFKVIRIAVKNGLKENFDNEIVHTILVKD